MLQALMPVYGVDMERTCHRPSMNRYLTYKRNYQIRYDMLILPILKYSVIIGLGTVKRGYRMLTAECEFYFLP